MIPQSYNGLFLCHIPVTSEQKKYHPIYVVNPTTKQFRAPSSPRVGENMPHSAFVRYALAFDPSKSPIIGWFAYPTVFVYVEREGAHHKIDIYSSETESWKHINVPFFQSPSDRGRHYDLKKMAMHFDHRSSKCPIYCNDVVHWIRENYQACMQYGIINCEFRRNESDVMHYFNFEEERLGLMSATPPIPLVLKNIPTEISSAGFRRPTESSRLIQRYCGESGGNLYLVEIYKYCMTQFDVMEMKRDYSGWLVKYHVDLNPVVVALPGHDWNELAVLCLSQEEETYNMREEDSLCDLWLHIPGKVLSYDLRNHTLKSSIELVSKENIVALSFEFSHSSSLQVAMYPYRESLASV